MTNDTPSPVDPETLPRKVDRSGLVSLFANRVRARIVVVLLHVTEPLTVEQIATGADVYESTVSEALDPLLALGLLAELEPEDEDGEPRYGLADDELTEAVRQLASVADERTSTASE
ncbi:MAG: hypothetical protein V5A55_02215 [Halovenus sp.]